MWGEECVLRGDLLARLHCLQKHGCQAPAKMRIARAACSFFDVVGGGGVKERVAGAAVKSRSLSLPLSAGSGSQAGTLPEWTKLTA